MFGQALQRTCVAMCMFCSPLLGFVIVGRLGINPMDRQRRRRQLLRRRKELPPLDDNTRLYEYSIMATDRNTLLDLLNGTKGISQYIEVSRVGDVYLLQRAKPKSTDAVSSVTCLEDLEVEIMGASEAEEAESRDRTQAFLPRVSEQSVPYMRYQRLIIFFQGVPLQIMAMELWSGVRMFPKKLDTNERIFFRKVCWRHTGAGVWPHPANKTYRGDYHSTYTCA